MDTRTQFIINKFANRNDENGFKKAINDEIEFWKWRLDMALKPKTKRKQKLKPKVTNDALVTSIRNRIKMLQGIDTRD